MKKVIVMSFVMLLSACSSTAGLIPSGREKTPDVVSRYIEQGAFFDSSKKEKLDYADFSKKKCQDFGSKSYKAYKVSAFTSGIWMIIPITDLSKEIKIWCQ